MAWDSLKTSPRSRLAVITITLARSFSGHSSPLPFLGNICPALRKRDSRNRKGIFFNPRSLAGDPVHLWAVKIWRCGRVKPDVLEDVLKTSFFNEAVEEKALLPSGRERILFAG